MKHAVALVISLLPACLPELPTEGIDYGAEDPLDDDGRAGLRGQATCAATMSVFPVIGPHNIGYDGSCNDGTCDVSCTGERANSDYGARSGGGHFHHGIDVFAHRGAELVAVASGHVVYAKLDTNGSNEVKIIDACGWSYFYGHLETFAVATGDDVVAGQLVGTMGSSGTGGVHLHFNASPGAYDQDVDPLELLTSVESSACTGVAVPPEPPPAAGSPGTLVGDQVLDTGANAASASGNFTLAMQADGNLVLYPTNNQVLGGAVWDARIFGANHQLVMQTDGNLVVYHGNAAVWNTATHGHPGAYAEIGEGVLRVRAASGAVLWSSR